MFFFVIFAVFVAVLLLVGLIVAIRDRRRHHIARESQAMWEENVREQARDMRASHAVHNVYNPDLSATDWGRRNRRS